jgi:hypothetical protein
VPSRDRAADHLARDAPRGSFSAFFHLNSLFFRTPEAENRKLASENTGMNEVIEKLKQLDVHMEKKRREIQ